MRSRQRRTSYPAAGGHTWHPRRWIKRRRVPARRLPTSCPKTIAAASRISPAPSVANSSRPSTVNRTTTSGRLQRTPKPGAGLPSFRMTPAAEICAAREHSRTDPIPRPLCQPVQNRPPPPGLTPKSDRKLEATCPGIAERICNRDTAAMLASASPRKPSVATDVN